MEDGGLVARIEEPGWMDRSGNIVYKHGAPGCKVTHYIIRSNTCVVGDEFGANTSIKRDGHAGGEWLLCERGKIPQQKLSTRDKHFTLMPLKLLTDEPLICILIIAGTKPSAATEMGIHQLKKMVDKGTDEDFIENNEGKEKYSLVGQHAL